MFDARFPPVLRLLSLFHGWLPILLVYLVWKLGYDRRAVLVLDCAILTMGCAATALLRTGKLLKREGVAQVSQRFVTGQA